MRAQLPFSMNQQSRKATLAAKWIAQAPEMLEDVELRDGRTFPRTLEVWVPKKKVHAPSMRYGPCSSPPETLVKPWRCGAARRAHLPAHPGGLGAQEEGARAQHAVRTLPPTASQPVPNLLLHVKSSARMVGDSWVFPAH